MADPILLVPGQIVLPDDFFRAQQQHAPAGVKPVKSMQPVPIDDPAVRPLLSEPGFDPQQTPVYRYYLDDGTLIDAVTQNDGQFRIISYKPSEKFNRQQAAAQKDSEWHTEGTPDPNSPSGYDNSRPIMVRTVNGQRETKAPSAAELKDWNEAQQRSRNPGGKTDAEVQAQQASRKSIPDPNHPGLNIVTTEDPTTKQTETHYEDANHNTVPTPPDAPTISQRTETRNGREYTIVTSTPKAGGTPTITVLGPDGAVVPGGLPDQGPVDKPITKTGSDGKTYIEHHVAKPDGTEDIYYTDQSGARVQFPDDTSKNAGASLPTNLQGWRPDPTKPGWGLFDRRDQLMAAVAQKQLKPDGTPFTERDAVAVLNNEAELTKTTVAQHVQDQNEQRSLRQEAMGQRSTDLNTQQSLRSNVGSMMSEARAGASPFVGKVAPPPGGSITGGILQGQYAIGRAMGAYDTPPDIPLPAFATPYGQQSQTAAASVPTAAALTNGTAEENAPWLAHTPLNSSPVASAPAITPPPASRPLLGPTPAVPGQTPVATGPSFTDPTTGGFGIPGSFSSGPYGDTSGQAPAMPAFAQSMLSPRAKLQALGYSEPVIDEALRRAGIAA